MKIICRCCKGLFEPRANVRNQRYCSLPECQKARHLAWRPKEGAQTEEKLAAKKAAQKLWRDKNPDYWKRYRKDHPESSDNKSKNRTLKRSESAHIQLKNGFFELKVVRQNRSVKSGVYLVELRLLKDLKGVV